MDIPAHRHPSRPVGSILEYIGDKTLIALVGLAGSILGVIGTLGAAAFAAWSKRKQSEMDRLKTYLESGMDAHQLAAELSNDVYERVTAEHTADLARLREDLERVTKENGDLRQEVHFMEHEQERNDRKMEVLIRVLSENLSPDTLELLQSALDEESDAGDLSLEFPRGDI